MTTNFLIFNEHKSTVETTELAPEISSQLKPLPEHYDQYFKLDGEYDLLPLVSLINKRARPEGIVSANALMREAAEGKLERRAPITVKKWSDSLWLVDDGNSTLLNARYSGWSAIPCKKTS